MELVVFWTDFSKSELKLIFKYYKEEANLKIAKKIVAGITSETLKLSKQPEIGQQELLLIDRKQKFRYLIFKNYKIIYWINIQKKRIEISDVFDSRQNPLKITRSK